MAAFVWGEGGAQMTPEAIAAQRKVAQAMMQRGGDYSPVQSAWQGAARVAEGLMGGLDARSADNAERRNAAAEQALLASLIGGQTPAAMPATVAPAVAETSGAVALPPPVASRNVAPSRIYSNDEPSPLDPPSGNARDMLVRTIIGEAGNQPDIGQNAVASVIRNRAVNGGFGGDTVPGVVQAPSQFEPWGTQAGRSRMAAIDPSSPEYQRASGAVDQAYAGNDPTNGATHFYSPTSQAALGRPAPAWDNGRGVDIAQHRFFGGAQPTQMASADPAALPPNAQPAQGYAIPGQPAAAPGPQMPPVVASWVQRAIRNPATRASALQILQQYTKPNDPNWKPIGKDADGTERYGFVDERARSVTPYAMPGTERPANAVIPPAPAGVDPKVWAKEQSERYTRGQLPATYEDSAKLRGEVQGLPSYKNLAQAAPVYKSMVDAAGRDNRGSDVNLIYGFAKVMDPGSVVRESEMTVAQAIATLPQQLQATVQSQLSGGGRLSADVRGHIMREARSRVNAYQGMFTQDAEMYRGIASRNRANPEDIIPNFGELPEWAPPVAAPMPATAPQSMAPATHVWDPQRGLMRK